MRAEKALLDERQSELAEIALKDEDIRIRQSRVDRLKAKTADPLKSLFGSNVPATPVLRDEFLRLKEDLSQRHKSVRDSLSEVKQDIEAKKERKRQLKQGADDREAKIKQFDEQVGRRKHATLQKRRLSPVIFKVREAVGDLSENNDDAAICAAIIAMAHQLGLKVIAEGIETDEQLEYLRRNGCDMGQGFFLGKPMTAEDFEKVLNAGGSSIRKLQPAVQS